MEGSEMIPEGWKALQEYARVREEFELVARAGIRVACIESAMLNVDALCCAIDRLAARSTDAPSYELALERLAQQWDGCEWEDCPDVGAAIRDDFAMHLAAENFTVKPGCDDLKPYGYATGLALFREAARGRALAATKAPAVPAAQGKQWPWRDACPDDAPAVPATDARAEPALMTDEQVAVAVESEFSRTGEWPEGDVQIAHAIQRALSTTAPAEAMSDTRRLDWLLPNLAPANFGVEFADGYQWESEAEFLAKWRTAIDIELTALAAASTGGKS
jgi:hypothetical protein